MRKEFKKVWTDHYGPKRVNNVYEVHDLYGLRFTVNRHRWAAPTPGWGWKATPSGARPGSVADVSGAVKTAKVLYADTIDELAHKLGLGGGAYEVSFGVHRNPTPAKPTASDFKVAADWLRCNEGEEGEAEACARVAAHLETLS